MHSVNDEFPPFVLNGVDSNQDMVTVDSKDLEGWRVFYFYPKDYCCCVDEEVPKRCCLPSKSHFTKSRKHSVRTLHPETT